jgi:hypothetical protein
MAEPSWCLGMNFWSSCYVMTRWDGFSTEYILLDACRLLHLRYGAGNAYLRREIPVRI